MFHSLLGRFALGPMILSAACGGGRESGSKDAEPWRDAAVHDGSVHADASTNHMASADDANRPEPAVTIVDDESGISRLPTCDLAIAGKCAVGQGRSRQEICERWNLDQTPKARTPEGVFTASNVPCDPGTTSADATDDALRRLNLYRYLVRQQPLALNDTWSEHARACSVIESQYADGLTHTPSASDACYTPQGAVTAGKSELSSGHAQPALAIDSLIWDSGADNELKLGHRHGMLLPGLAQVGIGFTSATRSATCLNLFEEPLPSLKPAGLDGLVAYPAPGFFPYETTRWSTLRLRPPAPSVARYHLWWSFEADEIGLRDATVRLYRVVDDRAVRVPVEVYPNGDTSVEGLRLRPDEIVEPASYLVLVDGTALGPVGYRVRFTECGPRFPRPCNPVAQDCGHDGYACYHSDEPQCVKTENIKVGEHCSDGQGIFGECEAGSECQQATSTSDPLGNATCVPYCDPSDPSRANSCETLCPAGHVPLSAERAGTSVVPNTAVCLVGSGRGCDPLAQDCGPGQGCYGTEAAGCKPAGSVALGMPCELSNPLCVPGGECVGYPGKTPLCMPYCKLTAPASDPQSCFALCTSRSISSYGAYGLCRPPVMP